MNMTEERVDRLEAAIERLIEAQTRTEQGIKELAQAQAYTEKRMEELAQAQAHTEKRVDRLAAAIERLIEAQARTDERLNRLEAAVEKLIEAQARTEKRVEELAQAQARTEQRVEELAQALTLLTQRVDGLTAVVERIQLDVSILKTDVSVLKTDVSTLKTDVADLKKNVSVLNTNVAVLKGSDLERKYQQHAEAYFGRFLRRPRALLTSEIDDAMYAELEKRLTSDEFNDFFHLDLLVTGQPKSQPGVLPVWLAVEVSSVIDSHDVERAGRRADALRKAGYRAIPTVAGERVTAGAEKKASAGNILLVRDGGVRFWEDALKAALVDRV